MQTLTPYLTVNEAASAIEFYCKVFAATEVQRWTDPDGRIGHAELNFGGARVFIADEAPQVGAVAATTLGGNPTAFVLLVADVDSTIASALENGSTLDRPITVAQHRVRSGWIKDPFGYRWNVGTQLSAPSIEEVATKVDGQYTITTGQSLS